jgi:hypothetical protein
MYKDKWLRAMCGAQAIYYIAMGLWPFLHMTSFLALTGHKTDLWLVRCVAALTAVIGSVLLRSWWMRNVRRGNTVLLGAGSAIAFCAMDLATPWPGQTSSIYFLDAAMQLLFVTGWSVLRALIFRWSIRITIQRSSGHRDMAGGLHHHAASAVHPVVKHPSSVTEAFVELKKKKSYMDELALSGNGVSENGAPRPAVAS